MKALLSPAVLLPFIVSRSLGSPAPALVPREVVTVTVEAVEPDPTQAWDAGATTEFPIHESCNATEQAQLRRAFSDGITLAHHAKEHILRWGNSSAFYQKYFGNAPTGEPIGWFERIVGADRAGMYFRCDDIDGNCQLNPTWGGHWRGSNASQETVICEPSYTTRWYLEGLCGYGYTVASGSTNAYFGSDMIHRWFHLPGIGEGVVEHYAEDYATSLELARTNPEEAVRNSDTLQYFALDVYAYDIAVPGQGCSGDAPAVSTSAAESATATATYAELPSTAQSASDSCHTHSDGSMHCD